MKNIFISSTFKDMQEERNLIHTQVMPSVNYLLKEKGEYANFLDFRWGIDTKGLSDNYAFKKVLSACFDAINNSEFFIVFIGDNYGSCVPRFVVDELEEQHHFVHNCSQKSITELEIECASFNNLINSDNIFFYFKDTQDDYKDERVENLKRKNQNSFPKQIRHYSAINENFTKQMTQDVLSWFNDCEPLLDEVAKNITKNNLIHFSCRQELINITARNVLEKPLTVIYGESGCGKSVFMSALENELSLECHTNIHYIKRNIYNYKNIIKKLWDFLGGTVSRHYPNNKLNNACFGTDYEKQISFFCSIISGSEEIKDFVFFIDGIDKFDSTQATKTLLALKFYSPKIHFVISVDNPDKYIYMQEPYCVLLDRLNNEEKKKVINKELNINHKALPEEVIHLLLQKEDSGLPLYLVLSIRRLVHMQKADYSEIYSKEDFSDSFNNHIICIVQDYSDDIENMIIDYIEFSERIIEKEEAINIVSFLAAGSYGFTETELYFLIEKYHVAYSSVLFIESDDPFKYKESNSFRDNSPLRNLAGSPIYANFNVAEFYLFYKYLGDLLNVNPYNGKMFFDNTIVKKAIVDLYHGEIILDAISNEIFYDDKDRVISDYEICNCILRTTFAKSYIVDPYSKELVKRYMYPPFYCINIFVKNNQEKQIELLASILFDLLVSNGATILKMYLDNAIVYQRQRNSDREESLNSIRFIIKYIFPRISRSMINPIEYVPIFEDCLLFLKKHMDYSILDNRLYIIMSKLNIAIMCYNVNCSEEANRIAKQCKAQLDAVPISMRNELFYDAVKTLNAKTQEWRM